MQKKEWHYFYQTNYPFIETHCTKNEVLPADLVTFTEEILNGKLHFLCSDTYNEVFIAIKIVI